MNRNPLRVEFTLYDDQDREHTIEARVTPGRKGSGPTYSHGGFPGEPPEVEVLRVFLLIRNNANEDSPAIEEQITVEQLLKNGITWDMIDDAACQEYEYQAGERADP